LVADSALDKIKNVLGSVVGCESGKVSEKAKGEMRKIDGRGGKQNGNKFKRVVRTREGVQGEKVEVGEKKKREEEMDVDVLRVSKKGKGELSEEVVVNNQTKIVAGLSEQPGAS
jgi:hypothetical protein